MTSNHNFGNDFKNKEKVFLESMRWWKASLKSNIRELIYLDLPGLLCRVSCAYHEEADKPRT